MVSEKENPRYVETLAGDISGADGATGLPSKLARYSEARHRALLMHSFVTRQEPVKYRKIVASLGCCAEYLVFRNYFTQDKVRLHAARFCKNHLLCPMCAIRRGAKMLGAYLEKYEAVIADAPSLRPFLVTVTVKNGEDLDERVSHLRRSMLRMSQMRRDHVSNPQKNRHVEFARSHGGFHSIEVTNRGKGWHPHAHMIWLCESVPDQDKLSQEWHAITGDSFVVDVRPLHDPVEGFLEVCKYALKFSDLSLADNFHAYTVMHGRRLIDAHGIMRGVEIPENLLDEPLDDLPYVELFYRFRKGVGYSVERVSEVIQPCAESVLKLSRKRTRDEWQKLIRIQLEAGRVKPRKQVQGVIYSMWKPGQYAALLPSEP
jgi:hypothetical protein